MTTIRATIAFTCLLLPLAGHALSDVDTTSTTQGTMEAPADSGLATPPDSVPAVPSRSKKRTVSPLSVRIHWQGLSDTVRTRSAGPAEALEVTVTATGSDTIRAFNLELLATPDGESRAWKFTATEDCPAATLTAVVEGDRAAPAPWRGKLAMANAKLEEGGAVRLTILCAFHVEPILPGKTYTLGRFRLVPPLAEEASADCAGWDAGARLELVTAKVLMPNLAEIPVAETGPGLVVVLDPSSESGAPQARP